MKVVTDFLRRIDRAVLFIVSLVLFSSGLYLAGPWYIPVLNDAEQPVYRLFASENYVVVFGIIQLIVGVALGACALVKSVPRGVMSAIVFTAFVVRLYSTIGVLIAQDGKFLPPSYLSQVAVVLILGAYWLYVKNREPK